MPMARSMPLWLIRASSARQCRLTRKLASKPPAIGAVNGLWLVVVGALALVRRPRRALLALLALVAMGSQAADADPFYLRTDLYQARGSQDEGEFRGDLAADGATVSLSHQVERFAWQLAAVIAGMS